MIEPHKSFSNTTLRPSDIPRQRRYVVWCFAWALIYCFASYVIKKNWVEGPMLWITVALPIVLVFFAIGAYVTLVKHLDEYMKKLNIEGSAIGLGITYAAVLIYAPLELAGAPPLGTTSFIVILSVGFSLGIIKSHSRNL